MRIVVDASAPRLDEPDDTSRFKLVAPAAVDLEQALGDSGWGSYDGSHAWIRISAVREAARGRVAHGWDERFAGMVDFAGERGWLDPSRSSIRCHVELTPDDSAEPRGSSHRQEST
jgi:hypothetical protein